MLQFNECLNNLVYDKDNPFTEIEKVFQTNSLESNLLKYYYYLEMEDLVNASIYHKKIEAYSSKNNISELLIFQKVFISVYKSLSYEYDDLIQLASKPEYIKKSLIKYPDLLNFIIIYLNKHYSDYLIAIGFGSKANEHLIKINKTLCNDNQSRGCSYLFLNLGISYLLLGDHKNALESINLGKRLIEINSKTDQIVKLDYCRGLYYSDKINFKLALEFFQKAFDVCHQENHSFKLKFSILRYIIYIQQQLKKYDESEKYTRLGISESIKQSDQKWEFIFENILATNYFDQRRYQDILELLEKDYNKYENSQFKYEKGIINFTLGETYLSLGNFQKSDYYFKKSLNYLETSHYKTRTINYYQKYSKIKEEQGSINDAIEILKKAEKISKEISNNYFLVATYFNMGRLLISKGDLLSAKDLLTSNLKLFVKINPEYFLPPVCYQLSEISRLTGNLIEAEEYNLRALVIINSIENDVEKARNYFQKGLINKDRGNYTDAEDNFILAIKLYQKIGDFKNLPSVYFELSLLKISQGEFSKSEHYMEDMKTIAKRYPTNENKVIPLLLKSIYLSKQKRAKDKFLAQGRLETIIEMESVPFKYKIIALIQMSQLLLYEYQLEKDQVLLDKVSQILDDLEAIGYQNNSYLLVIESYILRSNMAQYQDEYQEANDFLQKARLLSKDKNLPHILEKISSEEVELSLEITRIESALSKVTTLAGEAKSKYFENYLKKMMKMVDRFETYDSDEKDSS